MARTHPPQDREGSTAPARPIRPPGIPARRRRVWRDSLRLSQSRPVGWSRLRLDVVDDVVELISGREVHVLGVLERLGRMAGRPVKGLAGLVHLLAVPRIHLQATLEQVTPVRTWAQVVRQSGESGLKSVPLGTRTNAVVIPPPSFCIRS